MADVLRYKDLPEHDRASRTLPDGGTLYGRPVSLYCSKCGEKFSATRGDYFLRDPNAPVRHCGRPIQLVQAETILHRLTPEQARNIVEKG
jgi:hypothetical protein